MQTKKHFSRGFTIIELLVVISIIAILSSIILASFDSTRKKGRDAKRIADIKQIQLALGLYYDANGQYPPNIYTSGLDAPASGFMPKVPTDPSSSALCTTGVTSSTEPSCYMYTPYMASTDSGGANASCNVSYHLGASLETADNGSPSNALRQDVDFNTVSVPVPNTWLPCTRTGSAAADFSRTDAQACNNFQTWGVGCYDVTP